MTKNILQKMIGSWGAWIGGIIGYVILVFYITTFSSAFTGSYDYQLAITSTFKSFGTLIWIVLGFILGYIIEVNFFKKRRRR